MREIPTRTLPELEAVFWDFDGVIMDSNQVRDQGFQEVLKEFPAPQVEMLLNYHRKNGGLSRYVKLRYFYEQILGKEVSEEHILEMAASFSVIMKELLTSPLLLINETTRFISDNYRVTPMHVTSGSDQTELRFLCEKLGLAGYFATIKGSPVPKIRNVADVLKEYGYRPENCLLIGDSINDYEAAKANGLLFQAYNNDSLNDYSDILLPF